MTRASNTDRVSTIPPLSILLLSAAVGYISLSQEILWMRLLSYAKGSGPEVFGHVLGVFLIGIALGALLGRRVCQMKKIHLMAFVGALLVVASVIYFFSVPVIAAFRERNFHYGAIPVLPRGLNAAYAMIGVVAFLQGGIFTIFCHVGVRSEEAVGVSVSWIYLANIIGSTAGPLLTGFVLLDIWTTKENLLAMSIATAVLGGIILFRSELRLRGRLASCAGVLGIIALFGVFQESLFDRLLESLQGWRQDSYHLTIENRSGIIAIEKAHNGADVVYGSGMYDGRINVDPNNNDNGIDRAYFVAALHAKPTEMLVIGLSTGAWARVMADYPSVEQMTIVEINPGYLQAMEQYPLHKAILDDPDIEIVIDDGRRWLNRNPDRTFDFILMNSTWHWRSQSTNVLSAEFLELVKAHMKPGGVMFWNTTSSDAVLRTAAHVFKHVTRYSNFVAASDSPFDVSHEMRKANLDSMIRDGKKVFAPRQGRGAWMYGRLNGFKVEDQGEALRNNLPVNRIITDDNMLTEYKNYDHRPIGLGKIWKLPEESPFQWDRNWGNALQRHFGDTR